MEIKNLFKTFATRERDGTFSPGVAWWGHGWKNREVRPSRVGDFCWAEFTSFLLKAGQGHQLSVMGRFSPTRVSSSAAGSGRLKTGRSTRTGWEAQQSPSEVRPRKACRHQRLDAGSHWSTSCGGSVLPEKVSKGTLKQTHVFFSIQNNLNQKTNGILKYVECREICYIFSFSLYNICYTSRCTFLHLGFKQRVDWKGTYRHLWEPLAEMSLVPLGQVE